jgi:hypothetical protein
LKSPPLSLPCRAITPAAPRPGDTGRRPETPDHAACRAAEHRLAQAP